MQYAHNPGFHGYYDARVRPLKIYKSKPETETTWEVVQKHFIIKERNLSYRFYPHFHPYVNKLMSRLIEGSLRELQNADTDYQRDDDGTIKTFQDGSSPIPTLYGKLFSKDSYDPSSVVKEPYPVKDLDFTSSGAYSVYNWELFYHVPLTIAIHLSKNQRFHDAQRWLHYIFDPNDDSDDATPDRFWKVRPFHNTDVKLVEELLYNLSSNADAELRQQTINSIGAWKDSPFRPHVIARYRQSAYMFKTVMAYLDNLVAWGDSLFRQDTRETINEATQLYVLAANILGPRPQPVPRKGTLRPQTYANFKEDLDNYGNVLKEIEADIPFDLSPHPTEASDDERLATVRSLGNSLYFCVPRNDKLLDYWDTVADRFFKIRNSLNIQGIFRQLPLFEPPIDPALLAKAAASGLDIGAVVAGLNQPLPLVRFKFLMQKATEICQEVKSLGSSLLSAMEKEDSEMLAILRAKHEKVILGLAETVKYSQFQETKKSLEGLRQSWTNALSRYVYFERLLGRKEKEIDIPALDDLDAVSLEKMRLKASEPEISDRNIDVDIATDVGDAAEGRLISSHEAEELGKMSDAQTAQDVATVLDGIGAVLNLLPEIGIVATPIGVGGDVKIGGEDIAAMFSMGADVARGISSRFSYEANRAGKIASYTRREQEWAYQSNLAAGEINQLYKQIRAAQIREAIAEREWKNHQHQIKHAEEINKFLTDEKKGKKTNRDLYTWMKREVKGLYGQCYEFAFEAAKKAERALQHELGNPLLSYLQFGHLAGKEGLLAGEKLFLDIKRMEMAYHDQNKREYELIKHVSLRQLDPFALIRLRETGCCDISLPEELFDISCPGHYFRRIRSVAVTIPCTTGPFASVNCTLTLRKSTVRKTAQLDGSEYAVDGPNDPRFDCHYSSLQSIVTSSGQNDSGMFETNLHDERYLPFEGSGVISEWQLQLPANPSEEEPRQFDYNTIGDVVLHLRYTAREGGGPLRQAALNHVADRIESAEHTGSVRLFNIRHEFPGEWTQFKDSSAEGEWFKLSLPLRSEHYPFWSQSRIDEVKRIDFIARTRKNSIVIATKTDVPPPGNDDNKVAELVKDDSMGNLRIGKLKDSARPEPISKKDEPFVIYIDYKDIDDFWMAVWWGKKE
jgi:hypothetical protein